MDEMLTGRIWYNSGLRIWGTFAEVSHVKRLVMPNPIAGLCIIENSGTSHPPVKLYLSFMRRGCKPFFGEWDFDSGCSPREVSLEMHRQP